MSFRSTKDPKHHNHLDLSFSSPLVSPVASPSPYQSMSHSSASSITISEGDKDSRPPSSSASACSSPKESTKLPYKMDQDDDDYSDGDNDYNFNNGDLSMGAFSDYSAERFRCETHLGDEPLRCDPTVELDNKDVSQLSHKHVQFMLEDNHKLSEEVRTLKGQLSVLNGNNVSLGFQLSQCEAKYQKLIDEKNTRLIELESEAAARVVQIKAQTEAKLEAQAKLALAESTIESLNRQIGVMAKSDAHARLRENYEAMLTKLKNQHETEVILLKNGNEGLKYQLDTALEEIDFLKTQLIEKERALSNQELERLANAKDLKQKYENIIRDTLNKVEFESLLKKKNDEIESLRQELSKMKHNLSTQSTCNSEMKCKCGKKDSQSESECVKELKEEFEKCLANLQTRRTQVNTLQAQLTASKKENLDLKDKLKEMESKIDDDRLLSLNHQPLIAEIEARYSAQLDKDLKNAIRVMEKTQREEMENLFHSRLEKYVNKFINYLESLADGDCIEQEYDRFHSIFAPLRKIWVSINCNLEDRLNELEAKQQSIVEAKDSLEKVLNASKSIESTVPHSDLINQELEKIKEEVNQSKAKVDKYKRLCHRLVEKHDKEIEKLKHHYAKAVAEREKEYYRREEQLIEELSNNPLAMCRRLSNYINSAKDDR